MKQPTIIVTGASQGLGAAIASVAADQGAQVILTARSEEKLATQAQRITERGGNARAVVGDISRLDDCRRIIDAALSTFGRIDALVNNAGTIEPLAPVAETRAEEWARHIAVNLLGPMMMCRLAIPHLRETRGRVVNVTSHGAELVIPGASAYSASKAALNQFSKTLAAEEPLIAVILFIPGEVDTAMQAVIREKGRGKTTEDIYRFFVDLHEQGKLLPAATPALAAVGLALKAPLEWSGEILEWDDDRVQQLIPR
jgi:NAD(P)-dependent dehydrogenase (short-subunit alcohol dehydrogenase family)